MVISAGENEVTAQTRELSAMYTQRGRYIGTVRKLLELEDSEDNPLDMERFISNDPRTLWNMAVFLLQPRPLVNNVTDIDGKELVGERRIAAEVVEQLLNRQWQDINERHMRSGSSGLYWEIVGSLAAIGWYAVPYGIEPDRLFVGYWEPGIVYPEWSDDVSIGLVRVARIRSITSEEARRVARRNGWVWNRYLPKTTVQEHRLWVQDGDVVRFGVSLNNDLVKTLDPVPGLERIPVVTGGVGNTPNLSTETYFGSIRNRPQIGASILETNKQVYAQQNRQFSFLQQLLHDTANPKTYEKSARGDVQIVRGPEEFYKRGAHFRLGEGDELGAIVLPTIPPEAIQLILSIRNMIQRGGFSDTAFGNIAGQVTALVISQAAEAAQQIIIPYHQAMEYICTEISRYWISTMIPRPSRYQFLSDTEQAALDLFRDEEVRYVIKSNYSVQVPGDTAARIVMAKQAAPDFQISTETALRLFMPEIIDPKLEISKVKAARAENHPVFETVRVVDALRVAASRLAGSNPELAQTLMQGSEALLGTIGGGQQEQALTGQQGQPGAGPGVVPPGLGGLLTGGPGPATGGPNGTA